MSSKGGLSIVKNPYLRKKWDNKSLKYKTKGKHKNVQSRYSNKTVTLMVHSPKYSNRVSNHQEDSSATINLSYRRFIQAQVTQKTFQLE